MSVYRKKINLADDRVDRFREALVMGQLDYAPGTVTLDIESIGLRFGVRLTLAQAGELGAALVEAAGLAKASGE